MIFGRSQSCFASQFSMHWGRAWGERGGENGSDRVSSSWLPPTSFLGRFALLVRDHDHRADPSFTPLLLPLLLLLSPYPVELLTELLRA